MGEAHPLNDPAMLVLRDGLALQKAGRLTEAEAQYRQVLQAQPQHGTALHLLGIVLAQTGRPAEAVPYLRQSVALQPQQAVNLHNLAGALHVTGALDEAWQCSSQALALNPVYVAAYVLRASVLWALGRQAQAREDLGTALSLHPADPAALALQTHMQTQGQTQGQAEPLPTQGDARFQAEAGMALLDQRQFALAIAALERALVLDPQQDAWLGSLAWAKVSGCHWSGLQADVQRLAQRVWAGQGGVDPFLLLACADDPLLQRRNAEQYFAPFAQGAAPVPPRAVPAISAIRGGGERIRLAYLSNDFHEHATAYLMAQVFELHDRSRFEVTALSFGPPIACAMRSRLERAFEHFIDVDGMSDAQVVQWMQRAQIDIAVDLKGFTRGARSAVFAQRPAPVCVNYLGYPGTLGAACFDYIVGDPVVTPLAHAAHFAEQIAQLPHSYQPNDRTRPIAPPYTHRAAEGLPPDGFVFAAFNNPYKITAAVFSTWMRLLQQLPHSVLWLVGEQPDQQARLRQQAQGEGVDPARLVFARNEPQARHLARHALADLFLDTTPCNAHTTASDALWAGLPVLTCLGHTFAGRVAASLLTAVGLPELVTTSLADYEALALQLAHNPGQLAALRQRLQTQRMTQPLFDAPAYARHLEAAFATMHQRARQGLPPAAFAVAPLNSYSS